MKKLEILRKTIVKILIIILYILKSIPIGILSAITYPFLIGYSVIKFSFFSHIRNGIERDNTKGLDDLFNKFDLW